MRNEPDLALGLIETMLVVDGVALELEAHLQRLGASANSVYGTHLPQGLGAAAADCARPWSRSPGRLQVALWPVGDELNYRSAVRPAAHNALGPLDPPITLRPVEVDGGLGAHKWRDRRLLRRLGTGLEEDEELLILDTGAEVLETGAGNLFALYDDTLVTPAADHRLLPGVTRARLLEIAGRAGLGVEERVLDLEELGEAQELLVTSSLRGVVPVKECGAMRWELGAKTRRLQVALAGIWRA